MKQQNLSNPGFILLEAIVGVALFMLIMTLVLHCMVHITKQNVSLQARHKSLCAALYSIEHIKQQEIRQLFFDKTTHVVLNKKSDVVMPYDHPSIHWYRINAQSGTELITLYCAEFVHV